MIKETTINEQHLKKTHTKKQLEDILVDISWGKISKKYFEKSPSWIYNKLSETDGNGNKGGFTEEEKEQFKGALCDLADRIRKVAQNFK